MLIYRIALLPIASHYYCSTQPILQRTIIVIIIMSSFFGWGRRPTGGEEDDADHQAPREEEDNADTKPAAVSSNVTLSLDTLPDHLRSHQYYYCSSTIRQAIVSNGGVMPSISFSTVDVAMDDEDLTTWKKGQLSSTGTLSSVEANTIVWLLVTKALPKSMRRGKNELLVDFAAASNGAKKYMSEKYCTEVKSLGGVSVLQRFVLSGNPGFLAKRVQVAGGTVLRPVLVLEQYPAIVATIQAKREKRGMARCTTLHELLRDDDLSSFAYCQKAFLELPQHVLAATSQTDVPSITSAASATIPGLASGQQDITSIAASASNAIVPVQHCTYLTWHDSVLSFVSLFVVSSFFASC